MNQFRVRNVVLPAVLVASGVFSTLTLPFISSQSTPAWLQAPGFLGNQPSWVFDRENRDAAIRYVGGAIVVSVGAGIATIEILRRLHPSNRLSKTQKDALNSQIHQLESEAQFDPAQLSESIDLSIASWLAEEDSTSAAPQDINPNEVNLAEANPASLAALTDADATDVDAWDAALADTNLWDASLDSKLPAPDETERQEIPEEAEWMPQTPAESHSPSIWERDRSLQDWSKPDFVI